MDLFPTSDQGQLAEAARQFADRRYGPQWIMHRRNSEADIAGEYAEIARLGWPGLALPERFGGAGAGFVELCLVLEELGRGGATSPVVCSVAAALAIVRGESAAHADLLGRIAAGDVIATVALLGPGGGDEWASPTITGSRSGRGWVLHGTKILVPYAGSADIVVANASLEGRGRVLALMPLNAPGVSVTKQSVIGGEPRYRIVFDGAGLDSSAVLSEATGEPLGRLIDSLALLHSAHAVGAAEGALQLAASYAKDRVQFGQPIGSFQSVSNRCADMRLGIDAARLLVWEAAWNTDQGNPEAADLTAVAKAYLNEVGQTVILNSHQVHGALGVSTEYPLHVYTRLIKAYQASYGATALQLERVAVALGL